MKVDSFQVVPVLTGETKLLVARREEDASSPTCRLAWICLLLFQFYQSPIFSPSYHTVRFLVWMYLNKILRMLQLRLQQKLGSQEDHDIVTWWGHLLRYVEAFLWLMIPQMLCPFPFFSFLWKASTCLLKQAVIRE
jgi:hypothetical protein